MKIKIFTASERWHNNEQPSRRLGQLKADWLSGDEQQVSTQEFARGEVVPIKGSAQLNLRQWTEKSENSQNKNNNQSQEEKKPTKNNNN